MSQPFWLAGDATAAERKAFGSIEACLSGEGELVNDSKLSYLKRQVVGDSRYYVKVYRHAGRHLRRFVGPSRTRTEWRNQRRFAALGIPSARIVAFGERKFPAGPYQGVVVTEEVPGTMDLWTLVRNQPERLADTAWLEKVVDRLARHVQSMHRHRLIHNDLKWRNILVDFSNSPEVYIIDCPWGRVLYGPLFDRGVIKDLACLDRLAKVHLSHRQRMRFFKRYHETDCLTQGHRRQIGKILRFFEGRESTRQG